MLEFKCKNIHICLSFSFFALFAVLFYSNQTIKILLPLLACILHELGHIFMMCIYKCNPRKIVFYGGGIKICPNCRIISYQKEIAVLFAGCITNLSLGIVLTILGVFSDFAFSNITLGLFNLLPFKAFDGGQILRLMFDNLQSARLNKLYNYAVKSLCIVIIIAGIICMIKFKASVSLAVTICYIIVSEVLS